MGISSTYTPAREVGNGSKVDFDFNFKCQSTSELKVYKIVTATGALTLQTLGVDFTAVLSTTTEGGTVTYTTAPTALQTSFIGRDVSDVQDADIPSVSVFREEQLENALDKRTMVSQQLGEKLERTITFATTQDMTSISAELPAPVADQILGWNTAGTALENKTKEVTETQYDGVISAGLDASKSASPTVKDLYFATDTGKIYLCEVAGAWVDISAYVKTTGNETVAGVKTFSSFPITPSSAPTTDYQVVNKKYVNDQDTANRAKKIGTLSWDVSTTGDQAVTGVGFQPSLVRLFFADSSSLRSSDGISDATNHYCNYTESPMNILQDVTKVATFKSSTDVATLVVKTMDADGFTITKAKTNSPTGTMVVIYEAHK